MRDHGRVLHSADLPILEYDDDPFDPISQGIRASAGPVALPERAVMTLLGSVTPRWAAEHGYEVGFTVSMITGDFPIWVGEHRGVPVALAEVPVGAPAAVIVFEHLLLFGVRAAVATGCCGGLIHFEEGEFVVPTRALRDEGTSYHYLPASRWVYLDSGLRQACALAVEAAGLAVVAGATWTTDAFLRETPAVIAARRDEGCQVVDMECAALAAAAQFRGARFAQILFTADTLADADHDVRGWGRASRSTALRLALDAVTAPQPTAPPD